jgi:hypothetical protein
LCLFVPVRDRRSIRWTESGRSLDGVARSWRRGRQRRSLPGSRVREWHGGLGGAICFRPFRLPVPVDTEGSRQFVPSLSTKRREPSRRNVDWFGVKRRVFPQLALRASRQRRWGGSIGNGAASLTPRGSDTTSQHAGWSGDAGKVEHRDSRADGVSRDLRVTPIPFRCRTSGTQE